MKNALTRSAVLGIALGTFGLTSTAFAAEQTTAEVTFENGGLNIGDHSKNINFGTHKIDSKEHTYSEVDTQGKEQNSSLTIEDYRGDFSIGWTLTAQLQKANTNGLEISLTPKGPDYVTFPESKILSTDEQTIAQVQKDKMSIEKLDTTFNLNAKLHIPADLHLNHQTYNQTIVWNLEVTPTAK